MKSILWAILLLSWAFGAQAPATAPVALKDEPHHHSLFENDYARAWAFGITGHQATLLHNHDLPYFGIAVGSADFINAVTGKPEAHVTLTDGQVGYSKGGFSHVARIETDEVAVQSGEVASIFRIAGADTQPARLLAVLDQSELSVETPGQPAKKLHSGEALWLNSGAAATFVHTGERPTSRFVLVTFKDSGAK